MLEDELDRKKLKQTKPRDVQMILKTCGLQDMMKRKPQSTKRRREIDMVPEVKMGEHTTDFRYNASESVSLAGRHTPHTGGALSLAHVGVPLLRQIKPSTA